ncbi:uncharacterized protein LOC126891778 [Diabrotica virgifera virgifera]|uniref:Uncharacterized protein n=1 Tax=Diabrotica virgifera virgifera TaxID=50390 RepID=A0ABM5L3J5_DIAVI|nr:uncharacterized protein LOC126891778 [Diabrotica virgifera virgifera]
MNEKIGDKPEHLLEFEINGDHIRHKDHENLHITKDDIGTELRTNNEKIVEYIISLRQHRDELIFIIDKQYKERKKLETEMERITYKLCLINKSMAQRIKTKTLYDETIKDIENKYSHLVNDSKHILGDIKSSYENLEYVINKNTSTEEEKIAAD